MSELLVNKLFANTKLKFVRSMIFLATVIARFNVRFFCFFKPLSVITPMTLKENEHNELVFIDKFGENSIHIIHCSDNLEDLKEDVATPYLVAEEATNFARVHLVTDFSEDEALQQVDEYLREKEGIEETHLIGVFECEIQK